jgi:PPOX class probable F420-dependent enzyme
MPAVRDLQPWAVQLLEQSRVAHLAFVDEDDSPRVLPVTYVLADDALWSAIDDKPKRSREPARLKYLRRAPRAALTVDRYDDDWTRLAWVQVLVDVAIVDAGDAPEAIDALRSKYEQYRESSPPGPLIRLVPRRALSWSARPS